MPGKARRGVWRKERREIVEDLMLARIREGNVGNRHGGNPGQRIVHVAAREHEMAVRMTAAQAMDQGPHFSVRLRSNSARIYDTDVRFAILVDRVTGPL